MEPTDSRSRRCSSPSARASLLAGGLFALLALAAPTGLAQAPPVAPPGETPTLIISKFGTGAPVLAVPDCVPRRGDEASRAACRTVTQVLRADLAFEGFFRFVAESNMSSIAALNPEAPRFEDWLSIGTDVLVVTRAEASGADLAVDVRVHVVGSRQSIFSKRYSGSADNPRLFAHQVSDDVMGLAQQRGVARTKIAFCSDRDTPKGARSSKELYVADYDGFSPRRVTVNGSINILPAWSPDGRSLAYVSYRGGVPDLFLASIYEGRSRNLTQGRGQSFAPAFSPDGRRIAYASSQSGNMEIWVAAADGSGPTKITSHPAKDTAPFWSPTGREIAFTSDRTGTPQIYVMDAEGLNVRRLTTVGNYNDAPAWSPSKEHGEIAYTSRLEGGFEIAVVDLDTRQVRQVTQGLGSCEYPTWAPSGRHLAFSCRKGDSWRLTIADRLGARTQTLAVGPGNNTYPDWGP